MPSENGWEPAWCDESMLNWVTVPGTDPPVKLQIQKGQPTQILRAFVADMNAYVEPVYDADCACYTPTNSVPTSNHLNGTAVDIRWDSHPFHVKGTFGGKLPALRQLLEFYKGVIFWGGDWTDPIDEMHFNLDYHSYGNPFTDDFIKRKIRPDGFSTYKRGEAVTTAVVASAVSPAEKVLQYNHAQQNVAQEKFFDCCPASTQIVLDGLGVHLSEDELIRAIGTTTDGTNTVEQALPVLNEKTAGKYVAQWMPHDPPRPDEVEALWHNVKGSIDAGFGCVLNFEVPSSNFPRGTRGSASPQYRGAKVWHYVACMGWADDGPGGRHLWIADPGFPPFDKGGYWMSLEQTATAIPPHAYAYATAGAVKAAPAPVQVPVPAKPAVATPVVAPVSDSKAVSPAVGYNLPGEVPVLSAELLAVQDDALLRQLFVEWSAVEFGDTESVYRIIRSAAGKGADTSHAFIVRAKSVLAKVPADDLKRVLGRIEMVEPELLKALIEQGKIV